MQKDRLPASGEYHADAAMPTQETIGSSKRTVITVFFRLISLIIL
jgi:hypothetical protein